MHPLILPMAAQVAWAAFLYVLLTVARAPKIWGVGQRADGSNPWAGIEPRISANLSNQFEWPLFFYVACLLLIQHPLNPAAATWLAWLFIAAFNATLSFFNCVKGSAKKASMRARNVL